MMSHSVSPSDSALWRISRVMEETSLSRSTIYRLIEAGKFPEGRQMKSTNARVWFEADIQAWKRAELGLPEYAPEGLGDLL